MEDTLQIENDGPLIRSTNFWESRYDARGALYLSTNAGCLRLLVPRSQTAAIPEMRKGAKYVVISFLQLEKQAPGQFAVEWMVEDRSDSPWACHLSPPQMDRVPTEDSVGREWTAAVWSLKNGIPHKFFERPAYVRIVDSLPCMKSIEQ